MLKLVILLVCKKIMMSLAIFESFDNGDYIEEHNIGLILNYILANLNSYYSPNRRYWERQYNNCNKLFLACKWRKERNLRAIAKKGETVCGGELINFLASEKHKNCSCSSC